MKTFARQDGRELLVVPGFRNRVLSARPSVTPREGWNALDYRAAAARKLQRGNRLLGSFVSHGRSIQGARVLDVGCGDGANCLVAAGKAACEVVGIDLRLPLLAQDEKGRQTRRLAYELLRQNGAEHCTADLGDDAETGMQTLLRKLPVRFQTMDATGMSFAAAEFDLVLSRSAMEHIQPIESVLAEMARVVRPGGMIYLGIDPFFWLRGCHKRGVVDIPWAHARMTLDDFSRFVQEYESPEIAAKRRQRLETLNRFTIASWRSLVEGMRCRILDWREHSSPLGEQVLREYPEVLDTLLPGIGQRDLLCERVEVWLQRA